MTDREKLIELLCPHIQHDGCELFCNHPPCNSVIEAADDLIANGVTVHHWIPVTERLPTKEDADRFGRVFTVDNDSRANMSNWRVVNWYPDTFSHWMPLPTQPEED